jgi:hypothetical protein
VADPYESYGDCTDDIGSDAESMAEMNADREEKAAREQWNDEESEDELV